MDKKKKILQVLGNIEPSICAAGIFVTVISVIINVSADLLFGKRFTVAEEFASLGYIWVTFAGLGYLYRVDSFMEVGFVVKYFKRKGRYVLELIRLLYMGFFSAMLIKATFKLLKGSFIKKMVATQIPYFYLDISVLIGFSVMFVLIVIDVVKWVTNCRKVMTGPDGPWPDGGFRELTNTSTLSEEKEEA